MSTYIYLECLDHDPPSKAEGESGQHTYDIPGARLMIKHREILVAFMNSDISFSFDSHFDSNTAWFLYKHPKCNIGIRDEYGRKYAIDGDSTEPIDG